MDLLAKFMCQFRKPTGFLGRFVARFMNMGHQYLWNWGLNLVSIGEKASILDIGCGGGMAVNILARKAYNGKIYGIDYSEDMVSLARKVNKNLINQGQVEISQGSVSDLPFTDNSFDLVTAFETLYFWPNLSDDLKEIKRVLKPGGVLLICNEAYKDIKFEKRNSLWVKNIGMQIHTPDELHGMLTGAGYEGIEIATIDKRNCISVMGKKPA